MISRNDSHSKIGSSWSQLPASREKLRNRKAIRQYIEGIDGNCPGWQCVLYLNGALDLIGAMRWCEGNPPKLGQETGNILRHGEAIGAAGFILARSNSGETYRPHPLIITAVSRLRRLSAELGLPLLDYLVFPAGETVSVGGPRCRV